MGLGIRLQERVVQNREAQPQGIRGTRRDKSPGGRDQGAEAVMRSVLFVNTPQRPLNTSSFQHNGTGHIGRARKWRYGT